MGRIIKTLVTLAVIAGAIWYFFFASDQSREAAKRQAMKAGYDAKFMASSIVKVPIVNAGANTVANAAICRKQLREIEMAKRAIAERKGLIYGAEVPASEIAKQMGLTELPQCPAGGSYNPYPVGSMAHCSIGANDPKNPDDDHFVNDF